MPVAVAAKIAALSEDLGSQRRVAELLDVSPAQVTRWRQGGGIDIHNADRVDLLEYVVAALQRIYEPEVVEKWLLGLNPRLRDRRPIDVIRAGRAWELLPAIADERAGGYARGFGALFRSIAPPRTMSAGGRSGFHASSRVSVGTRRRSTSTIPRS